MKQILRRRLSDLIILNKVKDLLLKLSHYHFGSKLSPSPCSMLGFPLRGPSVKVKTIVAEMLPVWEGQGWSFFRHHGVNQSESEIRHVDCEKSGKLYKNHPRLTVWHHEKPARLVYRGTWQVRIS